MSQKKEKMSHSEEVQDTNQKVETKIETKAGTSDKTEKKKNKKKVKKKRKADMRIEVVGSLAILMILLLTIGISIYHYLWNIDLYVVDDVLNDAVLKRYVIQTLLSSTVAVCAVTIVLLTQASRILPEKKTCIYFVVGFMSIILLVQTNQFNETYYSEGSSFNYNSKDCERHGYLLNGTLFEIQEEDAYISNDTIKTKYLDNVQLVFWQTTEAPMTFKVWYKHHGEEEYLEDRVSTVEVPVGTNNITIEVRKKNVEGIKFGVQGEIGTKFNLGQVNINSAYQKRIQAILMRIVVWVCCLELLILSIIILPIGGKITDWIGKNKAMRVIAFASIPLTILFAFLAVLIRSMVKWMSTNVGTVDFSIIVLQLRSPLNGTDSAIIDSIIRNGVIPAAIIILLGFIIFLVVRRALNMFHKLPNRKTPTWYKLAALLMSIAFLVETLNVKGTEVGMWDYIDHLGEVSTFYEDYYINPKDVAITFPEKKRNLIYIYLESMESTYSDAESGGIMEKNLIPNLTRIANKRVSFTDKEDGTLGGAHCLKNTEFTVGGIVASTAGMHLEIANSGANYGTFLPNVVSLGDLLKEQGYNQVFLCGSEGEFAGRDTYFATHGDFKIEDYNAAKTEGYIEEGYRVFWGHEDLILYERAKDQLTELASKDEPFNFTMLTVDTHYPAGYRCKKCRYEYDTQYENAIACADKQLGKFFSWIKEQPFFENTTIVIAGDHTTMVADGDEIWNTMPEGYDRTVYNAFCNSVFEAGADGKSLKGVNQKGRTFSTMDIFPTTLAALGVEIEGNRLGLGTNLFSDTPTLMEELGQDYIDDELEKHDKMYNEFY